MARVLNLIIVILEILGFSISIKRRGIKGNFIFYTQISNFITLIASLLLVIFGQKSAIEVLRYVSVSMLIMTFFVTACILVPMSGKLKELLFSGSGLFHHLLVPIVSTLSYVLVEKRADFFWVWLPGVITLIYGIIMLYLNYTDRVKGPYPFFLIKQNGVKATVIWMFALMIVVTGFSALVGYHRPLKTDIKYVYVHGLSGWGSYDFKNEFVPYWGLFGRDLIRYMNENGYESYAASVDPKTSAWDRSCELYAQLTGTRVDYGKAHSEKAGHERFGEDFSGRPLYKDFAGSQFVLIGHSFGGATIRQFSETLKNGFDEEIKCTDPSELSPFFKGGGGENLLALVTLAAPTNGTTAYDLYEDDSFDRSLIEIPAEYEEESRNISAEKKPELDNREPWDYASFDMHIDNAMELNGRITTFDDIYYFSYPCESTTTDDQGEVAPNPEITEKRFMKGSIYMSKYTGFTKGGFYIDESWQPNDGLVNTVSARAPIGAPSVDYVEGKEINPGIWYVMPTISGDHISVEGGLYKRVNVKPFYLKLADMLAQLGKDSAN